MEIIVREILSTVFVLAIAAAQPVFAEDYSEPWAYSFDSDGAICNGEETGIFADVNHEGMIYLSTEMRHVPAGSFAIQNESVFSDVVQYDTIDEYGQKVILNVSTDGYIFAGKYNGKGREFRKEGNIDVVRLYPCEF